jgi:hypothetical protein
MATSCKESKRGAALPFASTVVGCVALAVLLPAAFECHPLALAQDAGATTVAAPVDAVQPPVLPKPGDKPWGGDKDKCKKKSHSRECKKKSHSRECKKKSYSREKDDKCRKHEEKPCCKPCKREKKHRKPRWIPASFDFSDVIFEDFEDKPHFPPKKDDKKEKDDDKKWDDDKKEKDDDKKCGDDKKKKDDDKKWGDDKKKWDRKRHSKSHSKGDRCSAKKGSKGLKKKDW